MDTIIGAIKSKSVWLGTALMTLPDWWPLIADQVTGLLGDSARDYLTRLMGIALILVRYFTTKPLAEKGKGVQ